MAHALDRRATCFAVKRQVRSELLRDANQRLRERLFFPDERRERGLVKTRGSFHQCSPANQDIRWRGGSHWDADAHVGAIDLSMQTTRRTLCNSLRLVEVRKG